MSTIISPFASGTVLDPEQGGTGIDAGEMQSGQVFAATGESPVHVGATTLVSTDGTVEFDSTTPGQIDFSAPGNASIVKVTHDLTPTDNYNTILVDATAGNVTITLPTQTASAKIFTIKKIDASVNTVTVVDENGYTIDGAASWVIAQQYASYSMQYIDSIAPPAWFII